MAKDSAQGDDDRTPGSRPGRRGAGAVAGYGLYLVLAVAALLLVAEGVARLVSGSELEPLFSDPTLRTAGRPFLRPHPRRGFALAPGFDNGVYRVNEAGFRGGPLPPDLPERPAILAVGDSATFGWQVGADGDWPTQLDHVLAERGRPEIHVINAGVPSYSSTQVRLLLEEALDDGRVGPDLVLVMTLWNDLYYGTVPGWYPELLVAQRPARWRRLLAEHSVLLRRLVVGAQPAREWDVFDARPLQHYAENLEAMAALCRARGVPVVFVEPAFAPDLADGVHEFRIRYTAPFFAEVAGRYLAALRAVADANDAPLVRHRFTVEHGRTSAFRDAIHLRAAGNRRLAEDVADALQRDGLLPPGPRGEDS